MEKPLRGVYPILTTVFDDVGEFDEEGQRHAIEFLLDARVDGLVTCANASEGYALSDAERERVIQVVIDQVRGRVPVIVGVSHPSTKVAIEKSRAAERAEAQGILSLPPFYGAWAADATGIFNYFASLGASTDLPVIVQDHPLSGIPLSVGLMARIAGELENVRYFKIEVPRAPLKMAELLTLAGERVLGIFGGMSGITFFEELERGACGTMPSSAFPDVFANVYRAYCEGHRDLARERFEHYLPLIRFELHLGGRNFQKELLNLGGIIRSAQVREPAPPSWDESTRREMIEMVQRYDLLALHHSNPT